MAEPQNATGTTTSPDAPPLINLEGLRVRTIQQAQSELPQPQITPPWEDEPRLQSAPTSKIGKAYADGKQLLQKYGQHFSEKVLAPFREGLDRLGEDLQQAGESGHTPEGGQLVGPARALLSGAGTLLKQVPVGRDLKSTALAWATPPELPEGNALSREINAWDRTGKDLGTVYHGGKTTVGEVDPSKLQQRDAGFYGPGFYVTTNEQYAKTYGSKVSQKAFNPDAKILDVATIHPGYEQKVNPELQKEIEATQRAYLARLPKAQKNPNLVNDYLELIDPKSKSFDLHSWIEAVNRHAEQKGYDAIRFSDGEIVVKNPKALATDLSGLRARAVSKEVPQKSPFRIAAETPDKVSDFHSAVQNTEGAELSDSGLTLDVVRHQKPEQAGERAIRTGVFFLPEKKSPYQRYYTTGRQGYGGTQRIEGRTTFENPIIAKGASGGKVPERAYDAINGEGAYDEMRQDVLDATTHGWNQRSHGELVQNVADVLENHGGNPDLAEDIVRNSKEGNTLAYAVQEHIVASSVRKAGHDGIVGFSKIKGQPRLSEVFDLRRDKYPISSQLFESKTATPDLSVPSDAPKTITVYRGGEPGKPGKYGSTFYAENPEYAGNFSADQNRTLLNKTITPKNPLDLNKPADALTVAKAMVKAEGTEEAPEEFAKSILKEGGVSYIHPKAAADLKSQGYDYLTSAHDFGSAGTSGRVWLELGESKPAIDLSGLRVRPAKVGRQPAQWTAFISSDGRKYRFPPDVTWEQIIKADPGAKQIK